jgi:hypothetical protein
MLYTCEQCLRPFQAPPSQRARFCDRNCYDKSREGIFKCDNCGKTFKYYKSHKRGKLIYCSQKCQLENMVDERHPHWQGKNYRKIFEKFLGRKLTSKDIVHHINGNHGDNRIENLVVTTRVEHPKKHPEAGYQKGHPQFNTGRTRFKKGHSYR